MERDVPVRAALPDERDKRRRFPRKPVARLLLARQSETMTPAETFSSRLEALLREATEGPYVRADAVANYQLIAYLRNHASALLEVVKAAQKAEESSRYFDEHFRAGTYDDWQGALDGLRQALRKLEE